MSTGHGPTTAELGAFFGDCLNRYRQATAVTDERVTSLVLGGRRVDLCLAGDALSQHLTGAFAHAVTSPGRAAELSICAFDTESTGVGLPPPAWGTDAYGRKGQITGANGDRFRTTYQPGVDVLQMYDRERATAIYWVDSAARVPWWEASFPFRSILHWWTLPTALQIVHAAAVGDEHGAVLLAGPSGSGKSSTALHAHIRGGLRLAGDDLVMVDADRLLVHSLYSTAKLEWDQVALLPELTDRVRNEGSTTGDKAIVDLHGLTDEGMATALPISGIAVPEVGTDVETTVATLGPVAVLQALAPTTLFVLPGAEATMMDKMRRVTTEVPGHRLGLGRDRSGVVHAVTDLVAAAGGGASMTGPRRAVR